MWIAANASLHELIEISSRTCRKVCKRVKNHPMATQVQRPRGGKRSTIAQDGNTTCEGAKSAFTKRRRSSRCGHCTSAAPLTGCCHTNGREIDFCLLACRHV